MHVGQQQHHPLHRRRRGRADNLALSAADAARAVEEEGDVAAGDNIEILSRDSHQVNGLDIQRLYLDHGAGSSLLQRALQVEALPESWKQWLRDKAAGARTIRV